MQNFFFNISNFYVIRLLTILFSECEETREGANVVGKVSDLSPVFVEWTVENDRLLLLVENKYISRLENSREV